MKVKDDADRWTVVYGGWTRLNARAQRDERQLLGRRDAGSLASARGITLGTYLEREWLPAVVKVSKRGRPLAPTTQARYEQAVRRITISIGKVRLAELRASHVERLREELLASGRLAPQTVSDILRVLAQALAKATARGLIGRNHADAAIVNRPASEPSRFAVVTPELGKRILRAARSADPWDVAAHLALGMSLRREEVLGLGWEHVDLEAGILRVRRTLTYAGRALHWGPPKSAAGKRDLPVPGFVAEALRRHRAAQLRRRLLLGESWPLEGAIDDLVVDKGDGGPWLPPSFSTYWARWAEDQGFGEVTFHGLRHGTATLLLAAGVPDRVVIEIMGHADTRILRRYQEVVPELLADASARLEALLAD
ncbi:MAG: site-specific integrase [Actinomycetota bacterium]|nr:site-specific integrase [Actinomycetota bacterium]